MSGMAHIRKHRGVPAKRGGRVFYKHLGKFGTIRSAKGGYLRIQLDGYDFAHTFHPTWQLDYLNESGNVIHSTGD